MFTVNQLYERYLDALRYNDVDMMWYYIGEMLFYITNFPPVELDPSAEGDPDYQWERDPAF